ncbi:hypothetical protein [Nocardioides bruguierae]|uniref:hypothetical protein n=1 Tax=Nocardioides bruguierae TaxID=2945102 RepID=UPI0020213A8D|nr:hypothetical protein [Nocardioides bruguierae]MCL8024084.1 hypothetical protein [Nocardioides bruguierae]
MRVRPRLVRAGLLATALLLTTACSEQGDPGDPADVAAARDRLGAVQSALEVWAAADDLVQARAAAEAVSNLVTGPGVHLYGDTDGDGSLAGAVDAGLLPGEQGEPSLGLPLEECAGIDLLGGSWADPAARWRDLTERIEVWAPDDNRFPELPSHAQRVVGWAQLTLATDSLEDAHEYAGHAQLHVTASVDAVDECG